MKTEFSRSDLVEILGSASYAKCNTLSRHNLGYAKTVRTFNENAAKNHRDVIRSIIFYNTDECIEFFENKIRKEESNAIGRFRLQHIKNWNEIVEVLKIIKGEKQ